MENRYPIGKLRLPDNITANDVVLWIKELEEAPENLRQAVLGLTTEQLNTPYRIGGWRLSQVVHHLADSHVNGYVRIKMGLTENQPLIRTFEHDGWASLEDNEMPIEVSLMLFETIHKRLIFLLKSLKEEQLKRTVEHPERGILTIDQLIAIYTWHGKHHIAQIITLREQKGW